MERALWSLSAQETRAASKGFSAMLAIYSSFSNTPFKFWLFVSVRAVIYDIGDHISKIITNFFKCGEPALVLYGVV